MIRPIDSLKETQHEETLCTLGTVSETGSPHLCTVYFAYYRDKILFLSEPDTSHAMFLAERPQVAIAIASTEQPFGSSHKGTSLRGTAHLVGEDPARQNAFDHYAARFPDVVEWLDGRSLDEFELCVFEFIPTCGTVVDGRFEGSESRKITF